MDVVYVSGLHWRVVDFSAQRDGDGDGVARNPRWEATAKLVEDRRATLARPEDRPLWYECADGYPRMRRDDLELFQRLYAECRELVRGYNAMDAGDGPRAAWSGPGDVFDERMRRVAELVGIPVTEPAVPWGKP